MTVAPGERQSRPAEDIRSSFPLEAKNDPLVERLDCPPSHLSATSILPRSNWPPTKADTLAIIDDPV